MHCCLLVHMDDLRHPAWEPHDPDCERDSGSDDSGFEFGGRDGGGVVHVNPPFPLGCLVVDPVPIAGAVVAVPPVPLPAVRPPRTKHPRYDVPGGWIIIRPTHIDAHCNCPTHHVDDAHGCRTMVIRNPSAPNSILGRQAAWLMAWLAHGPDCEDKEEHASAAKPLPRRSAKGIIALSISKRNVWRDWLHDNQPVIEEAERLRRVGEPIEQPEL